MITTITPFDEFYPPSSSIYGAATGKTLAHIGFELKLRQHLAAAVLGDRERESKLINRIGQIRRHVPRVSDVHPDIKQVLRESRAWLEAVGRKIDFMNEDPRHWISARGGGPRW